MLFLTFSVLLVANPKKTTLHLLLLIHTFSRFSELGTNITAAVHAEFEGKYVPCLKARAISSSS